MLNIADNPLLISPANTKKPLRIMNRSGNRPSHEGAAAYCDDVIVMLRRNGFRSGLLRGDTDFSQTEHLDRWNRDGVLFHFGYDACGESGSRCVMTLEQGPDDYGVAAGG